MRATCSRKAPPSTSLDFSRSNARGRSDLHSPNDAWTSQTHVSPGIRQDRRGTSAASSPFRSETASLASQRPVARGCHSSSAGWAGHIGATPCTATSQDPRDGACVPRAARVTGTRRSSARGATVRFRGWCDAALRCQRCHCGCSARCHAMRRAALTIAASARHGRRTPRTVWHRIPRAEDPMRHVWRIGQPLHLVSHWRAEGARREVPQHVQERLAARTLNERDGDRRMLRQLPASLHSTRYRWRS